MPFRFSLQAVLRLRQNIEHQQELRLRAANQQVSQMQYSIMQVQARQQELRDSQTRELGAGTTAAEIRFGLQCDAQLILYKRELERQLLRLQQIRDQQREIFQQVRRMRETLESVRDGKLRDYKKEVLRREQRELDDLFLLRREFLQRG
jgi:flagellar export protein FliJ